MLSMDFGIDKSNMDYQTKKYGILKKHVSCNVSSVLTCNTVFKHNFTNNNNYNWNRFHKWWFYFLEVALII